MISKFSAKTGPFVLANDRNKEWYKAKLISIFAENTQRSLHNAKAKLGNTIGDMVYDILIKEKRPADTLLVVKKLQRIPVLFDGAEIATYQTKEQHAASTEAFTLITVIDGKIERAIKLEFTSLTEGKYSFM